MKNSFFLVIPDQQNNPEKLLMFESSALQQWLDELPTANPGLSTRLFFDLLKECNKLEMDAAMRLQALEILRPNYLMIQDYLRSRLIKSGFPKASDEQKIYQVLIALEREFAIGYWIVVRELNRKSAGWFQGKNTALSIQRVIKGLSDIVISHYLMCENVPDWVWIDLHSLYKLGVKLKKETVKVSDNESSHSKSSSIEDCYRQILLLSLAEPSGLMQKEILLVYQFISKLFSLIKLTDKPEQGMLMLCVILVDEDQPPFFSSTSKFDSAALYIDFERLFKALKRREKYVNEKEARFSSMHILKGNQGKLPLELLNYLEQRWSGIPLEGTPFFSDRLDRFFAVGLNATHDLQVSSEQAKEEVLEHKAESASERTLSCQFDKAGAISIGSLVSFRKANMPESKRSLGVVNKLAVVKADGIINFEVEALTAQSHSVSFLKLDAKEDDIPQKALIYGVDTKEGQKSFLIIESFYFKDEDLLRLFMNNDNFPIILRDKKNIGLGYWQFECRQLEETQQAVKSTKGYDFI